MCTLTIPRGSWSNLPVLIMLFYDLSGSSFSYQTTSVTAHHRSLLSLSLDLQDLYTDKNRILPRCHGDPVAREVESVRNAEVNEN
ncbi:hypothetical protein F5878DRAFT_605343 [Lentinula raphanica]|uniref:Secreted protein n=1 Tax=Lentinula raphanica TaxID=153919 RepID=A0AA38PI25_9AGAR|nr:hypothetical protein C8R42DRAFT_656312 [Lentinula raphanica]KAJ3843335.1 hypothetical protein F5878DRAFT_605343 [Lentinula raphanica]